MQAWSVIVTSTPLIVLPATTCLLRTSSSSWSCPVSWLYQKLPAVPARVWSTTGTVPVTMCLLILNALSPCGVGVPDKKTGYLTAMPVARVNTAAEVVSSAG